MMISNRVAQQADPFENHTPPIKDFPKIFHRGVQILNEIVQFVQMQLICMICTHATVPIGEFVVNKCDMIDQGK